MAASPDLLADDGGGDQHGFRNAVHGADSLLRTRPAARRRSWLRIPDGGAGTRRGGERDCDEYPLDGSQSATPEPGVRNFLHGDRDRRIRYVALDGALSARAGVRRGRPDESHGDHQHAAADVRVGRAARARDEYLYVVVYRQRAAGEFGGWIYRGALECANRSYVLCDVLAVVRIFVADEAQGDRAGAG